MSTSDGEPLEGEEVIDGNNDNFANMDFGNLAGLFKNIDMSQIMSLLGSVDIGQLSSLFGPMGMNSANVAEERPRGNKEFEVLNALKPMVNSDKADLIDMILQIYTISKILR
ncbi:hypothetical protein [Clostridium akagii]|uniref:hypothetical protein n=1 Tax=Clostridium akagii TaxID=91623 RepID=UPI00047AA307|nr:hypothetical protein [Clostridium akagii]